MEGSLETTRVVEAACRLGWWLPRLDDGKKLALRGDGTALAGVGGSFDLISVDRVPDAADERRRLFRTLCELLSERGVALIRYGVRAGLLTLRRFRRTLLCRKEREVRATPAGHALQKLFLAAWVEPVSPRDPQPSAFRTKSGSTFTNASRLVSAALVELGLRWPCAAGFEELLLLARTRSGGASAADPKALTSALWQLAVENVVQFFYESPPCSPAVPARPQATSLARAQAAGGEPVTSLHHTAPDLGALDRAVLALCDGTRSRSELRALLGKSAVEVDTALQHLQAAGLLRSAGERHVARL